MRRNLIIQLASKQTGNDLVHTLRTLPRAALKLLPRSESSDTMVRSLANKRGLSLKLDGTLREGAHDMRVFGLGFLRSLSSRKEYEHFTVSFYHIYAAMEDAFIKNGDGPAGRVWSQFPDLARTEPLLEDLRNVGLGNDPPPPSPATAAYISSIKAAHLRNNGAPLLGHLYVRYFADLFGGRALGTPTMLAVPGLVEKPHFYRFSKAVEADRRAYIEHIYEALNQEGGGMDATEKEDVVEEARNAFAHNALVYTETPGLNRDAALGAFQLTRGALTHSVGLR